MTGFPRFGKPSASEMPRIDQCPYSHKAQAGIPDEETKDSAHGDLIHAALGGTFPPAQLTTQQQITYEICKRQEEDLATEWGADEDTHVIRERRLGLTVMDYGIDVTPETKADLRVTGQGDVIYIRERRIFLPDYKSLNAEVPHAVENAQLATLSVLAWKRFGIEDITPAIIQPLAGRPTVAHYDSKALPKALEWMNRILHREENAVPSDRRAGPACKHCKALAVCEVAHAAGFAPIEKLTPLTLPGGKATFPEAQARTLAMPHAEIAALYRGVLFYDIVSAAVKSVVRHLAATDPDFQANHYREEKAREGNRELGDPQKVLDALAPHGVTAEALMAACSLNVTETQDALRKASGVKSVSANGIKKYNLTNEQAKALMDTLLRPGGLLTNKKEVTELVPVTPKLSDQ